MAEPLRRQAVAEFLGIETIGDRFQSVATAGLSRDLIAPLAKIADVFPDLGPGDAELRREFFTRMRGIGIFVKGVAKGVLSDLKKLR